jgi:hypothetical protein
LDGSGLARNILKCGEFLALAPLQCDTLKNLADCGIAVLDISTLSAQYLFDIGIEGCTDFVVVAIS